MNTQPPKFKVGDRVTYDNFPGPRAPAGLVYQIKTNNYDPVPGLWWYEIYVAPDSFYFWPEDTIYLHKNGLDTMLEVAFPEESI